VISEPSFSSQVIKKWKQRQQLAKWLKDHGKNLEEINSLLEQWGKGEQSCDSFPSSGKKLIISHFYFMIISRVTTKG
jgi:DNA-binding transcriptional MerR regulator